MVAELVETQSQVVSKEHGRQIQPNGIMGILICYSSMKIVGC